MPAIWIIAHHQGNETEYLLWRPAQPKAPHIQICGPDPASAHAIAHAVLAMVSPSSFTDLTDQAFRNPVEFLRNIHQDEEPECTPPLSKASPAIPDTAPVSKAP